MSADLRFICQSLLANRENIIQYDAILDQFISSLQIDSVLLAKFAEDDSLASFIQCMLFVINRSPIPSPTEGKVPKKVTSVVQFMTQIAYQNPDICRCMAANVSSDALLANIFKKSAEDAVNRNANPQRYLPFLKLVTVLACESDLFISSTESLGFYFTVCLGLFDVPEVGKWAVASLAALVRNCPAAASFIKASPSFAKIKANLASHLSSDDPALVIASLTVLVLLFPTAITPETSVRASVNSLSALESFPPGAHLISWIISELNESSPLSAEEIWKLLQVAMRGGMRAFVIYNMLIDLASQHLMIIDVMQSMNCLFALISSLLECDDGFVAVAGCSFLFTVFQDTNDFVLSEDVVEPFTKALHLVLAMRKHAQKERREAGVLLLRFMVRSRESITYVVRALQEHEQSLFLDFQRQIELNNPYLSVVYFLFLYDAAHFLTHWRQKLMALVMESQFPGLLTFVITTSRNRRAIGDALRASQIIADGFKNDVSFVMSPMFESLVSGYLLLNQKRYDDERKVKSETRKDQEALMSRINAIEVERDCCEREIISLRGSLEESANSFVQEQEHHKTVNEENAVLKKATVTYRIKIKKLMDKIKELTDANTSLETQLKNLQRVVTNSSLAEAGIRTKMTSISQLEQILHETQQKNEELQEKLKRAKVSADNDQRLIERTKQKMAKMKKTRNATQQRNTELERIIAGWEDEKRDMLESIENLSAKLASMTEQKNHLEQCEAETSKLCESLKRENEKIKRERDSMTQKADMKFKTVDDLQDRIAYLEDRQNEFQMLVKLIHKTTSPNQQIPKTISSFMKT